MLRWSHALLLFVGLLFGTRLYAQDLMNQGRMLGTGVLHRVPFPALKHEITDNVVLRGHTYTFIFDTGAPLAISKAIQDREHYPVLLKTDLTDANGQGSTTLIVQVDTVRLGTLVFCDVPAVVLDLANSPLAKMHVEGLIGSNLLRHLLVRFDAAQHEVLLSDDPVKVGFDAAAAQPAQLDGQSNFALALRVADCFTDTVQVDSGMGAPLLMSSASGDRMMASCPDAPVRHTATRKNHMQGMLGKDDRKVDHYKSRVIRLGTGEVRNVAFSTTTGAARIGRAFFAHGVLILDYPRKRFTFTTP